MVAGEPKKVEPVLINLPVEIAGAGVAARADGLLYAIVIAALEDASQRQMRLRLAPLPKESSPGKKDKRGREVYHVYEDWRCTTEGTRLNFIVFNWPKDGKFVTPAFI